MQFRAVMTNAFPALLCAAVLGCGSSASGHGTMSVHLVDGPEADYKAILLQVKKLEIHGPTGWETLADFTTTRKGGVYEVDLLSLRGVDPKGLPIKATLTDGVALPEGHYDQMRMLLGAGNTVKLADDSTHALKIPSGMQSGLKFPVSFDVAPNTTRDVFIDMDAHRSIFLHQTGGSDPKYLLRPVVHAVDRLVTGYITGTLTARVGGAPLGGVDVMAETVDTGHPAIVRTVQTDADGKYVLDLLPAGGSYFVVAQPVTATGTPVVTTVYLPKASASLAINEAAPAQSYSAAFDAAAASAVGTVSGGIAPPITSEDKTDTVFVLGTLATGTTQTQLAVRTKVATVDAAATPPESYLIDNLPFVDGGYTLAVERTDDALPTPTWTAYAGAPLFTPGAPSQTVTRNLGP